MCPECGGPIPAHSGHIRKTCQNKQCIETASSYYVHEADFLLGTDSPANIARRLGLQPKTLARLARRWGRDDVARVFDTKAAQRG